MNNQMYTELLLGVLGEKILKEISTSSNKEQALIKALLYMIYLNQDNPSPAKHLFIQGLLNSFPALQDALTYYKFQLTEQVQVKVVLDEHENSMVTINKRYIDQLAKEMEDEPSSIESVPRSFIGAVDKYYKPTIYTWHNVQRRFVGFFDFMGFKNIVEDFKGRYEVFHDILSDILTQMKKTEHMNVRQSEDVKSGHILKHEDRPSGQLKMIQFSDSILVITNDDSSAAFTALQMASLVLFNQALINGYLLRGALACGEVVADIDQNIFFGQAIVDAYLLEEQQQWFGVAFHKSVYSNETEIDMSDLREKEGNDIPISLYVKTPLKGKDGQTDWQEMEVLNWPIFGGKQRNVENALGQFKFKDSKKLNSYYNNTLAFVKESFSE